VVIKYKNKTYDSVDVPFFIFFKNPKTRKDFVNFVNNYKELNTFTRLDCVHGILAGSSIIKDKRSTILINIENKEEKQFLQKNLFAAHPAESNALLISPGDIDQQVLEDWVSKNLARLF
jgi:hypothetical protein